MRVLVIVVIVVIVVVVIVTWESKANSSSSVTELQTGTELGKRQNKLCVDIELSCVNLGFLYPKLSMLTHIEFRS